MWFEHVLFWIVTTRDIVCKQSHNKLYNWPVDSSRRSIVHLSRERTTPRISSWTPLKYYIHFSFILKLIIFIYKQLKRPVAFSVVHFDIKPQIVMLQTIYLFFYFIWPWRLLLPKTLVTPRTQDCSSIGPWTNGNRNQEGRPCDGRPLQWSDGYWLNQVSAGQLCDLRTRPIHVALRTAIYRWSTIVNDAMTLGWFQEDCSTRAHSFDISYYT